MESDLNNGRRRRKRGLCGQKQVCVWGVLGVPSAAPTVQEVPGWPHTRTLLLLSAPQVSMRMLSRSHRVRGRALPDHAVNKSWRSSQTRHPALNLHSQPLLLAGFGRLLPKRAHILLNFRSMRR